MSRSKDQTKDPFSEIRQWAKHPVSFAETILGDDLWWRQVEILDALTRPHAHVAVKGCHASGKSMAASRALIWWLLHDTHAIAVTTAPTATQVKKQIWAEVNAANQQAKVRLFNKINLDEVRISPTNYAIGLSTNDVLRFQGWHGKILIILDEAPGVFKEIWDAIAGTEAGGDVRVLAMGNPTLSSGTFHDLFNQPKWMKFSIDGLDTPNTLGYSLEDILAMSEEELDNNPCPYLITRRYIRDKYYEWGTDHPDWYARIRGQFPPQTQDALFHFDWLQEAKYRPTSINSAVFSVMNQPCMTAGLDVAGSGKNETVLTIRYNDDIVTMQGWADPDPRSDLFNTLEKYKAGIELLNVDGAGIGYYLGLELRDLGYPVQFINNGEAAENRVRFTNRKSELYWGLRQRFENSRVNGLIYDKAITQLSTIRWRLDPSDRISIEGREALTRRGVVSPDWADSLVLAFTPRLKKSKGYGVLSQGIVTGGWSRGR